MQVVRTSQVLHRDLELLPGPAVFTTIDLSHDVLEFRKASPGVGTHVMLSDLVPVFLWHLSLDAAGLDFFKPLVDGDVFLGLPVKHGWVSPRVEDRVEVEFLDLECLEHRAQSGQGVKMGWDDRNTGTCSTFGERHGL